VFDTVLPRLTGLVNGLFARRPLKTGLDTRLSDIFSEIDLHVNWQQGVERVLCQLDAHKEQLRSYFRDHLGSEVAATAITVKVLNLCLSKYHSSARNASSSPGAFGFHVDDSQASRPWAGLDCRITVGEKQLPAGS
jgi:hypothetical protein